MRTRVLALIAVALLPAAGRAQSSLIPQVESRPGAAYTLYLDFGGFSFTGNWGGTIAPGNGTPGTTPAYNSEGASSTFTANEIANMKAIWSRVAEKYIAYNVNVTTIDPAAAAGQAGSDLLRQAYYDNTAKMMHTVIGGSGSWTGGGGVSYLSVTQNSYSASGQNGGAGAGLHTNWVFSGQAATNLQFVAEASAHENGHGLKLNHQSVYSGTTLTNEYSPGTGTGTGSVAPIMGNSYSAQRGTWRSGTAHANSGLVAQNDAVVLLSNAGIGGNAASGFMDSGIGHTAATATPLPSTGSTVNSSAAAGFIAPNAAAADPLGEANYTTDYFALNTNDGPLNITLRSGRSTITAGTADPGATLNATLRLLAADGTTVIASSASGVLTETINIASLPAGTYYLQIVSAGGQTDADGNSYFDMGSYFLTGTYTPVPEPAFILAACAAAYLGVRRRAARSEKQTCQSRS